MEDELTAAMHSEFTIDAETEIKHKAWDVWKLIDIDASESEIRKEAESYGITREDALRYKDSFLDLSSGE